MFHEIVESLRQVWPQWYAAFAVCILSISSALAAGWTSPYLAQLTSEDSPLPISSAEASWVASLLPLGRVFGAFFGSITVEYFGSKTCLFYTAVPLLMSWICVVCATTVTWLYVYRTLSGVSMGMIFTCFPLYVGEISKPAIRGALVGLVMNGMPIGTVVGNIMGSHMSMMWFGIVSLIPTTIYVIIFSFLPQSPYHLARKGYTEKATLAILWYHRKCDVQAELEEIEAFVECAKTMTFRSKWNAIQEPKNRRALVNIMLLFLFMQLSGLNSLLFYMEIIVRSAKVTFIQPSTVVILINFLGIFLGLFGMYAIDRYGRKILLAVSSLSVAIGLLLLGLHFMLLENNYDPESLQWLLMLGLIIFMLLCVGMVPVPPTMLGELFPANLKSVAGFVSSITSAIFAFMVSKSYQQLVDLITLKYVLWLYSFIMIICFIYAIVSLPETKGKTLQEIQRMLERRETMRESAAASRRETPGQ